MLTAAGVGSGIDVEGIIGSLMTLERRSIDLLQGNKFDFQTELSAIGQLKSGMSTFQSSVSGLNTLSSFEIYKPTVSDTDVFTATTNSSASPGTFDVVVQNLAEAHKMGSTAKTDKDTTTFGAAGDQLTFTIDTESFTVDIGGKTLEGIRDAINDASDNAGMSAAIVSENDTSHRLVFTSVETGTDNAMSLAFTDSGGSPIADPIGMSTINTAENSSMLIDGLYTISRASNTINDAIDGVTFNLLTESASTVNLSIDRDVSAVTASVQSFVDAYNKMHSTFDSLREGSLQGDSTLRSVENNILNVLNTTPTGLSGSFTYLSELGVSLQKDGTMSLDASDLEDALSSDFQAVAELFADDDQGYLFRMDSMLDSFLDTDGALDARTDGLNDRIDSINDRIEREEYRLELREKTLRAQYTAMDTLIAELQSTSNFLTQQLSVFAANRQ